MDSKLNLDSRMADLDLSTTVITAAVKDIPGATIVSDDVVFDMTKFAPSGEAVVVACELIIVAGNETAALSNVGDDFTANFTTNANADSIVRVTVKRSL